MPQNVVSGHLQWEETTGSRLIQSAGQKASAIAYSIAEDSKANGLKPYEYFRYLLEELPKHGELEDRPMSKGCFRGPRYDCRNAATRKGI